MINENLEYGQALTMNVGGFEATGHPSWHIQYLMQDGWGLTQDMWLDAHPNHYNEDVIDRITGYSVKFSPLTLKMHLMDLRLMYPHLQFRIVIRVESEKDVGF